jgi:hypothetical protein
MSMLPMFLKGNYSRDSKERISLAPYRIPIAQSMIDALMTSEVAGHCCGSQRTVIRWGQRGELEAYKLPERGDYRVLATEVLSEFCPLADLPDQFYLKGGARCRTQRLN